MSEDGLTGSQHVFVYGSLMCGLGNAQLLSGPPRLSEARTAEAAYTMLDLGDFPAVIAGGADRIVGELYEVDPPTLARLDGLEQHPDLYCRQRTLLEGGSKAWMYLLVRRVRRVAVVPGGDWRAWLERRGGGK
ncbi:MAG: gamma-glutamylcyclotransferase family protein [Phycisphaeraceae bacterium]